MLASAAGEPRPRIAARVVNPSKRRDGAGSAHIAERKDDEPEIVPANASGRKHSVRAAT
jgi:hypothetical protein